MRVNWGSYPGSSTALRLRAPQQSIQHKGTPQRSLRKKSRLQQSATTRSPRISACLRTPLSSHILRTPTGHGQQHKHTHLIARSSGRGGGVVPLAPPLCPALLLRRRSPPGSGSQVSGVSAVVHRGGTRWRHGRGLHTITTGGGRARVAPFHEGNILPQLAVLQRLLIVHLFATRVRIERSARGGRKHATRRNATVQTDERCG